MSMTTGSWNGNDNTGVTTAAPVNDSINQFMNEKKAESVQQPTSSHSAPQAVSMHMLLSGLDMQSSLSEAGMNYLNTMRKSLEDSSWGSNRGIVITTQILNDPTNAWAFIDQKSSSAMIVLFNEDISVDTSDVDIRMTMFGRARKALHEISSNIEVINTIAVFPEDYSHVQKMITDIKNSFVCESSPHEVTLASLSSTRYVVDTNADRTRAEVMRLSPHGVQPFYQYGFTINVLQQKESSMQFFANSQKKEYESRPIAAVVGRTRIIGNSAPTRINNNGGWGVNTGKQFMPISEITGIFTPLKNPEIMALILPIAQQMFIMSGMWKLPYLNVGSKEFQDIGNLFQDVDGTVMSVKSTGNMTGYVDSIIENYFHAPRLALSVTEGRSRIRGLEWYTSSESTMAVINMFNKCYSGNFDNNVVIPNMDIAAARIPEFIGIVNDGGEIKDDRGCIDFINVVAQTANNYNLALPLRGVSMNPNDMLPLVKEIAPSFVPRSISNTVIFDFNVLNRMSEVVAKFVSIAPDNHNQGGASINMVDVLSQFTAVSNGSVFNGSSFGSVNGGGNQSYLSFIGANR